MAGLGATEKKDRNKEKMLELFFASVDPFLLENRA